MCSFIVINQLIRHLAFVNFFLQRRGPDATTHTHLNGFDFVHNLLHMTGERTPQPFVHGRVAAVFNGEIYNWKSLDKEGRYRSDGDAILPAYLAHGTRFVRHIDGEYAIAVIDFEKNIAVLATDVLGTKPFWYALIPHTSTFAIASYKSALVRMGLADAHIRMMDPNTVITVDLTSFQIVEHFNVYEFDLRQFKTSTDDYVAAFERAVWKRSAELPHSLFVGLSSGYDSGAIHAALHQQQTRHFAFALFGEEDVGLLYGRLMYARKSSEVNVIAIADEDFEAERRWLAVHAESCGYLGTNMTGQESVLDDHASTGLSYIIRQSRDRSAVAYLSGTGADEILSDYGFAGEKFCSQSSFGGLFPNDLGEVFPWSEFFMSTQHDYLMKEEIVAGAHGVEGRYPFLDPQVVQEFLWLAPSVKNGHYKAPLHDAFERWAYPYERGKKRGFAAKANMLHEESSVIWRYHAHAPGSCGPPPPGIGVEVWCSVADGTSEPRCEAHCAVNHTMLHDSLRCGLHGKWVGHLECFPGRIATSAKASLVPRPPVIIDGA